MGENPRQKSEIVWLNGFISFNELTGEKIVVDSEGDEYKISFEEEKDLERGDKVQFVPRVIDDERCATKIIFRL